MTALLAPELIGFVTMPHTALLERLGYDLPSREEVLSLRKRLREAEGTVVEVPTVTYFVLLDASWDEEEVRSSWDDEDEEEVHNSWPNGVAALKFADEDMDTLILDLKQRGVLDPVGVAFLPGSSLLADGFQFIQMNGHHRLFAALFLGLPTLPVFVQEQSYGYNLNLFATGDGDYGLEYFEELLAEGILTPPSVKEGQDLQEQLDDLCFFLDKLVATESH